MNFADNERVIDLKVVDYDKLSTIKSTRQLQFQGEIFWLYLISTIGWILAEEPLIKSRYHFCSTLFQNSILGYPYFTPPGEKIHQYDITL